MGSACFPNMLQVRAHVEVQIGLVAQGKADKSSVVAHTVAQFRAKFLFFVAKVRAKLLFVPGGDGG